MCTVISASIKKVIVTDNTLVSWKMLNGSPQYSLYDYRLVVNEDQLDISKYDPTVASIHNGPVTDLP